MEKRKLNPTWNLDSWTKFKILQQPNWPDRSEYDGVIKELKNYPALIFPDQIKQVKHRLKQVANNKAFLLQGGECAESFKEFSETFFKSVDLGLENIFSSFIKCN